MLDCPKCGRMVDGLECGHCGFTEPGAYARMPTLPAPDYVPYAQLSPAERTRVDRAIAKCKETAKRMSQRRGDAIPHIGSLAAGALAGISYDAAAVAERRAIQQEGCST